MKKSLLFFAMALIQVAGFSQEFLPFTTSNYAGVTGVGLQPASSADSRFRTDIGFMSGGFGLANNLYALDHYVTWHPDAFQDNDFFEKYVTRNYDGKPKSGMVSLRLDPFSFMLSASEKSGFSFTSSARMMINFDNVTEDLARLLDKDFNVPELWKINLDNANFSAQVNAWAEYDINYARVLIDQKQHFLKAGVTAKVLQGIGAGYMFVKDLSFSFKNADTLSLFQSQVNYGTSDNFGDKMQYTINANPTLGFDFGVVYEYRPDWAAHKYNLDGDNNLWRRDENKYLLKVGLSLCDLGSVAYERNPESRDFVADISDLDFRNLALESVGDFDHIIDSLFIYNDVPSKYKMNLPTALSMQMDLRVARGLYVNLMPYLAFNRGYNDENKTHYLNSLNFIPRYDLKWFGISLPVQYNSYSQLKTGIGLRIGPFWVGSNDVVSNLFNAKNIYGTSVSFATKIPLYFQKPKDRDKDGISNRKDKCPSEAGTLFLAGCPDSDNDSITDTEDQCPRIAGSMSAHGCPDRDRDGVKDDDDQCPDVRGKIEFNGCPDTDGDGITDAQDLCPNIAGTLAMNGCPDQDSDGIADNEDNCPTLAGTRANKGCPFVDSDGDGLKDENDACPQVAGPKENGGCPYNDADKDGIADKDDDCPSIPGTKIFNGCPDTDGDGISDKYDQCPNMKGVAENKGCPEIKKEEQETIRKAFDNLEFETGKSIIKSSSFASLDELAEVLKKRPEFILLISGHTDNVGNAASNLKLSKDRSIAVQNHLIAKGVSLSKLHTEWFGQTQPIAPNTTPEGRQKNRRVEMKIVFQ